MRWMGIGATIQVIARRRVCVQGPIHQGAHHLGIHHQGAHHLGIMMRMTGLITHIAVGGHQSQGIIIHIQDKMWSTKPLQPPRGLI